jgi:hypothetical protein
MKGYHRIQSRYVLCMNMRHMETILARKRTGHDEKALAYIYFILKYILRTIHIGTLISYFCLSLLLIRTGSASFLSLFIPARWRSAWKNMLIGVLCHTLPSKPLRHQNKSRGPLHCPLAPTVVSGVSMYFRNSAQEIFSNADMRMAFSSLKRLYSPLR